MFTGCREKPKSHYFSFFLIYKIMQYICLRYIRAEMTYTWVAHPPQNSAPTIVPLARVYDVQLGKQNTEGGRDRQTGRQQRITYSCKTNTGSHRFFHASCICSSVSWDYRLMIHSFARATWHTVAACKCDWKIPLSNRLYGHLTGSHVDFQTLLCRWGICPR